ncbi:mannose-specific lectin-like [Phalaenopsis equestris]|uniref:mannose-specific lectin-like n=1 Tax=Phalaenopsis equestris TaxID=78828 RepID=UPI0009E541F5|nr:mannose-specific lectin-like [Phalaenopsis equestris]
MVFRDPNLHYHALSQAKNYNTHSPQVPNKTLLSLQTAPVSAADRLNAGQSLGGGQSLAQGPYIFIMQKDCNLVLYDNNKAVWATGTNGKASGCYVTMQRDGNLVIYSGTRVIWASNTNRQNGNYYLILQRDRNVVIYDNSNNAIWATGTNVGNAAIVVIPHSNGTAAASGAAQNKVKELYP